MLDPVDHGMQEIRAASPGPAGAVRLGAELALKLHEAPDLDAVRTDVGLDGGGDLADGGQVGAEQVRAPG